MSTVLADWDPRVFETLSVKDITEDYEAPMPIFISSNF
jgi:hypothetical protein